MENPFRSEAAAYRFLLLTIGAFALIVAAKVLFGAVAATVVWVLITLAVLFAYVRQRGEGPPRETPVVPHAEDERRILVIANEAVGDEELVTLIHERSEGVREEVLVVAPALTSAIRHWTSDEDGARQAAQERLEASLARLRSLGVSARGEVGADDPLQAIEDALRTFGADEIILATHPEGRSSWLERGVVEAARERFDLPITHVVADGE
ncbi:MAG: hypothetical protein ACM33B_11545 [Pseudomonadota bacterium]